MGLCMQLICAVGRVQHRNTVRLTTCVAASLHMQAFMCRKSFVWCPCVCMCVCACVCACSAIDYMLDYRVFTFDPVTYPPDRMRKFVEW